MSLTDVVSVNSAKASSTAKRKSSWSWILIHAKGQSTVVDVERYAMMRRVQIRSRDLRILDPKFSSPPTILCRERAIVLSLEYIKMVITNEEVWLVKLPDENVNSLVEEIRRRLDVENKGHRSGKADWQEYSEIPFEFRVFEVVLKATCSFLNASAIELETSTYPAMDKLTSKVNTLNLERVRQLKSSLINLTYRVKQIRCELENLLDDDDDMAELYLSRKLVGASSPVSFSDEPISLSPKSPTIAAKISRAKSKLTKSMVNGRPHDVAEIEMLLETYFTQIDNTLTKLKRIREVMDDTEDYINIQLDRLQNELLRFELLLSIASICISVYSLVSGILSMNIPFSWDKKEYMFTRVVSVTGALCAVLFGIIMSYARFKRLLGT